MKNLSTLRSLILTASFGIAILSACNKDHGRDISLNEKQRLSTSQASGGSDVALAGRQSAPSGTCNPTAYAITLESRTYENDNWVWIWSVQNTNPGNGNNGTVQDLSHWGMQFGACMNITSLVSASFSSDGSTWTDFTPSYQVDPSQPCMTSPVLKFDYGTSGSAKSYYKLVISQEFPIGTSAGYYKSGVRTGCCTFNFDGIGCEESDEK